MKILMVCLGNICRSPLAHGILQDKIDKLNLDAQVDSAGTNGYHNGELPDSRSIEIAKEHDLDITYQNSRQIEKSDLEDYDLIFCMDQSNYNNVTAMCSDSSQKEKVKMIMNEVSPGCNTNVPDPYYGGEDGFVNVYNMLDEATDAIIKNYLND